VLEACDDCNTVSGDGCSSTCTLEAGYTCTGGGLTGRDVCYETCGDGKCYGSYKCDDGNVVSNDGCSSACQIETGWKCVGCTTTTASTCTEICGDGYVVGTEACDDGNSVAGDGCTSCTIDYGWACNTLTAPTLIASTCYALTWPNIIDYYITDNDVLTIKFNETIDIGSKWNESDWSITIDGPIPPYNFTWSLY
jgi:cysteine-rich repeat protein